MAVAEARALVVPGSMRGQGRAARRPRVNRTVVNKEAQGVKDRARTRQSPGASIQMQASSGTREFLRSPLREDRSACTMIVARPVSPAGRRSRPNRHSMWGRRELRAPNQPHRATDVCHGPSASACAATLWRGKPIERLQFRKPCVGSRFASAVKCPRRPLGEPSQTLSRPPHNPDIRSGPGGGLGRCRSGRREETARRYESRPLRRA